MSTQPVALVTGASSGFGELTAKRLAQRGYTVFGTSRKKAAAQNGVEMLVMDVQSDSSVQAGVTELLARTQRIDLLVNNAGLAHVSATEETSATLARNIFETNFWGVVRVTNAVLPTMRQQRRGRIINVGSLAGLVAVPGQGFYSASKFALEGYSESLSLELGQFNIHVSVIEPSFFKTKLDHGVLHDDHLLPAYQTLRETIMAYFKQAVAQGEDPQKVAELIVNVAENPQPNLRYRVGNDAVWTPRLKMLMPEKMFRDGARRRFKLPA
ncbi:MAG: SDR family NAD(P)-dependent oxidoreductase [Chloroflexi bacterium]|nr:SDR family NAD(P)-dependent oxidoreductase [Chloroflexota bacterium]